MFGVSTDQVVIWPNAKELSEVTKGNRSVGLEAKITVVMSRSQITAFTENTQARDRKAIKLHKIKKTQIRHVYSTTTPVTNLGKKMLSTTTKSCMRTSLSAFWLKLPTVWVMPNWMAPFRADDVVWRGKDSKHGNKQYFTPVMSAISLTILGRLARGIPKLILEYKHQTAFPLCAVEVKKPLTSLPPHPVLTFL